MPISTPDMRTDRPIHRTDYLFPKRTQIGQWRTWIWLDIGHHRGLAKKWHVGKHALLRLLERNGSHILVYTQVLSMHRTYFPHWQNIIVTVLWYFYSSIARQLECCCNLGADSRLFNKASVKPARIVGQKNALNSSR